jgi:tripartite tricarboxylate transporter family receptor
MVLLLVLNMRAPAMQDLVAGQIDLIVADLTTSLPQMRAGYIKPYAFSGRSRSAAAPDVPTADEAGITRVLHFGLECDLGSKGHAEGRHRQAGSWRLLCRGQRGPVRGDRRGADPIAIGGNRRGRHGGNPGRQKCHANHPDRDGDEQPTRSRRSAF